MHEARVWAFMLTSSSAQGVNMDDVHETVHSFLERCKIPYPRVVYDEDLDRLTREDLTRRGCSLSGLYSVAPYIATSVSMAANAYAHTPRETQTFVSVYTTLLIYLDDTYSGDSSGIEEFNTRFILSQKQRNPALQCLAECIHEITQRYSSIASNIMVISTLNLVTALLVEQKTKVIPVSTLHTIISFL
jgi:hypothetical protein